MFNNVINFISSTNFLLIIVVLAAYNLGSKYIRTLNLTVTSWTTA